MKPVTMPFCQSGIWRSSSGVRGGRLQHGERLADAHRGLVDLVEEQDARHAELFQFAQDHAQRRQLALVRLADDDRGVAERQHVARLMREFDRAGQVDEGVAIAQVIDGSDIGFDAGGVGARLGAAVADRGAVAHRSLPRQGTGAGENAFEQGGLAALERTDEGDQSRPGDALVGLTGFAHGSLLVCRAALKAWVKPACRKYFTWRTKSQRFCSDRSAQASRMRGGKSLSL